MRCAQQIAQRRRHQGACIGSRNSSSSHSLFLLIKSKFLLVKAAFFQVEFHLLVKFSRCESHYQVDEDKIRRRNACLQAAPRVMCSTLALLAGNFPINGHFNWKIIYTWWIFHLLNYQRISRNWGLSWSSLMSLGWIGMNIYIHIYIYIGYSLFSRELPGGFWFIDILYLMVSRHIINLQSLICFSEICNL